MNAKKCDRCGKFYDEYNNEIETESPNYLQLCQENMNKQRYVEEEYDLCLECMAKLQKWLKGEKTDE